MSCRTVLEILEQSRDELLPTLVRSALDAHLGSCPECARLGVLESELAQGLASVRAEESRLEPPANFRRQVKERLLASDRRPPESSSPWIWGLTGGLATAACLVLAIVASFALRDGSSAAPSEQLSGSAPAAGARLPLGLPAPARTQQPVSARFGEGVDSLDLRTAPLLYATPEVEVFYGAPPAQPPQRQRPEGAGTSHPREYHF